MRQVTFKLSAIDCLEPRDIEEYVQKVFAASRNFFGSLWSDFVQITKAFETRLILPSWSTWWRLKKAFCDLNKIISKWPKKVSRRCKNFLSILLNIFGFQAIYSRKFECPLTHRRKYFTVVVALLYPPPVLWERFLGQVPWCRRIRLSKKKMLDR